MFGFIYRNCSEFSNVQSLLTLYYSFIRSRLEYAAVIWFPIYSTYIQLLESVQRKFLKFVVFLVDGIYPPRGYNHGVLLSRFNCNLLSTRRVISSVKLLHSLISNITDCTYLFNKIVFLVPRLNARSCRTFYYIIPQ